MLKTLLSRDACDLREAMDGEAALASVQESPPDLILLDVVMPGMDGIEVCKRLKEDPATRHIPVVIVTGLQERDTNLRALEAGADDFLTKPLDVSLLRARIRNSLRVKYLQDQLMAHQKELTQYNARLEKGIQERTAQLARTQHVTVFSLAKLAESRDEDTGVHLDRMRRYVREIAQELASWPKYRDVVNEDFISRLYESSPLHDIGKVGIPDEILLKPGKLTPEEFEIMKLHTVIGGDALNAADIEAGTNSFLAMGRDIAYYHHEKYDGSGYPRGLRGDDIPLPALMSAVGDVYDALTSRRPYKDAFPHEKARAIILEGRGTHFAPDIVEAFERREREFIAIREAHVDTDPTPPLKRTIERLEHLRRTAGSH